MHYNKRRKNRFFKTGIAALLFAGLSLVPAAPKSGDKEVKAALDRAFSDIQSEMNIDGFPSIGFTTKGKSENPEFIPPSGLSEENRRICPNGVIYYPLNEWTDGLNAYDLLRHEIGHYYICQKYPVESLSEMPPNEVMEKTRTRSYDLIVAEIIQEGIAEYFKKGRKVNKSLNMNPRVINMDLRAWSSIDHYSLGFCIVDPLIDAYGTKAIDYLMKNMPLHARTIGDLVDFRTRAFSDLKAAYAK